MSKDMEQKMTLSNNLEISAETFTDRAEKFFSENENKKAIKKIQKWKIYIKIFI